MKWEQADVSNIVEKIRRLLRHLKCPYCFKPIRRGERTCRTELGLAHEGCVRFVPRKREGGSVNN